MSMMSPGEIVAAVPVIAGGVALLWNTFGKPRQDSQQALRDRIDAMQGADKTRLEDRVQALETGKRQLEERLEKVEAELTEVRHALDATYAFLEEIASGIYHTLDEVVARAKLILGRRK